MILHGLRLLVDPSRAWSTEVGAEDRPASWLVAAALTASLAPAVAVVAGHFVSVALGEEEVSLATLRAVVGFTSAVGGILVLAPALSLLILWIAKTSRGSASTGQATSAAMGILWPASLTGVVLCAPPLLGLPPDLGEILWLVLATAIAGRTLRRAVGPALRIRRRWAMAFLLHGTAAFALAFALVAVAPAMLVRNALGDATRVPSLRPEAPALPLPPAPDW